MLPEADTNRNMHIRCGTVREMRYNERSTDVVGRYEVVASLIRTIVLVVVVALFVRQARQAAGHQHKPRAFMLAAAAFGLFAIINALNTMGMNVQPLVLPVLLIAVILLSLGLFFLVRAWRAGEMREQVAQLRKVLDSERQRRNTPQDK